MPEIIAIDGRAASGKTTLALNLAELSGGSVVHMDDFFLPENLRTKSRLAEPGGNIHYERFLEEVVPFLVTDGFRAFSYRVFDCAVMDYRGTRTVAALPVIVEGVYSCHPLFGEYMDVKLFGGVSTAEQMKRLTAREGAAGAARFREKWLELEERYFAACWNIRNGVLN